MMQLSDLAVKRMKPPAKGQVDMFDMGYPGFALRLSYGGAKSWVYFYRIGAGENQKQRRLTAEGFARRIAVNVAKLPELLRR